MRQPNQDAVSYGITLLLDDKPANGQDELEVCRFKLRAGSRLRQSYDGFEDMATEYDTVNVIESDWGGLSGKSLSPAVTGYFARLLLEERSGRAEDIQFAYLCLNQPGAVSRYILEHYAGNGPDREVGTEAGNRELYNRLVRILSEVRSSRTADSRRAAARRQILVD